jgi:penicillin-binding protein 2
MSAHPNDIARRARIGSIGLGLVSAVLIGAFFRAQVIDHDRYKLQSEENRLRAIPLPAPRGIIYDRHGAIIAENLPGYSVSMLATNADSLRAELQRLSAVIQLTDADVKTVMRRYRRDPNRPTVIISDASFDVISVLEEHQINFPQLVIQSVPKRFYPDGPAVASFVGYTGEITDAELNMSQYQGYKPGQIIGKTGLEKEYEKELRGREGVRYDEVDARGRVVRQASPQMDLNPEPSPPLYTNIDLDLQKFMVNAFGDSLQGGAIAIDPRNGQVLALYSAPSFDPNRFTGGIPPDYWHQLLTDPRRPLYNKVVQGSYPPGSTFKLITAVTALQDGLVTLDEHMPIPCRGGLQYGSRYFKCWKHEGHGDIDLTQAIEQSCDTYFYQLGLKIGLSRLIAGGVSLGMRTRTGIDLPEERQSTFPYSTEYYNKRYGPRGWTNAVTLNIAIGQGENGQTVVNMAQFYTALATGGYAARPEIAKQAQPSRERIFTLTPDQMDGLRKALAGVVSPGGTAAASHIEGLMLAGKTGSAQHAGPGPDHAWFMGFAPADNPSIVVGVMIEFGAHGSRAAHIASSIVEHYLKASATTAVQTEG